MSTLKPEHVRDSLLVGHFGRGTDLPPPGDPITILPMVVEIERLKCYDGNIRLVPNPKYDELHLAIKTQGPEAAGVLPITRRPNDELYMIAKGGNTRLQIIQKFWMEKDPRFRVVQCLFHPWPGEAKVLADHIAENENRGEMIFIEKALALRELKRKMEQEGGEAVSLREFERRLNDPTFKFGLRVSKSQLHRLQYASDFLYPLFPETLKAGLGPRQVEQIQKLEALSSDYWQRRGSEQGEEAFRTLFADVLSRHDGPDFSIEAVRHALEIRLAEVLDRSLHTVQAGIAALEAGVDIGDDDAEEPDLAAIVAASPALRRPQTARPPADTAPPTASQPFSRAGSDADAPARPSPPPSSPVPTPAQGIAAVRERAYEVSRRLAGRHGLENCITASPGRGLGYWIDLPARSIAGAAATAAMWWMLVGLSEELAYLPGVNHVACMPEGELKNLVTANRLGEIHARVGRDSSWIVLPHQLRLSDADVEDLVLLFRTVRCLRESYAEADLWGSQQESGHEL